MNPFVNPNKRDVLLPGGCKDLIDVLRQPKRSAGDACQKTSNRFESGKLVDLHQYVTELVASPARDAALTMASMYGQLLIAVERSAEFFVVSPSMEISEADGGVEEFFAERGIQPCVDYLVGHSGTPTRVVGFPLPCDPPEATRLMTELIRAVYSMYADAELEFTYFETEVV